MIEREPITVICSKMGWIRAMKGHQPLDAEVKFKDGDEGRFVFHAETTDRISLVGSNGRFYTLMGANLPGGRGMGEPVRLMVDLPNEAGIAELMIWRPGEKLLLASSAGDGFVVASEEVLAQTRAGKAVMNLSGSDTLVAARVVQGDHVAVISKNRKLLVFPLGRPAGNGARQGRAHPEIPYRQGQAGGAGTGWRAIRHHDVQAGRWSELDDDQWPDPPRDGDCRVGRQARHDGQGPAPRLPARQPFPVARGKGPASGIEAGHPEMTVDRVHLLR